MPAMPDLPRALASDNPNRGKFLTPQRTNLVVTCDPAPAAQFQWFRLWASTNADMRPEYVFATNRSGQFTVPFTNGPQLYTVLAVVDEALPFDSAGRAR